MKKSRSPKLIVLVALFLAGCAGTIDKTTLATRMTATDPHPAVVDVRTGFEYREGHLPGAVNIPLHALPFRMSEVGHEWGDQVVVYCAHGPRSALAGFFLRLAGYSQVTHLRGDIQSWREAGYPLVTGPEPGVFVK